MQVETAELETELSTASVPERSALDKVLEHWANPGFRRKVWIGLVVVVVIAAWLLLHYYYRVTTDDAQVDGRIVPIASKVYGNVAEVLITDNQAVKKGDVLVRIDNRDYRAKLEQARAALALAESQALAAQVGVPLTDQTTASGLSAADASVAMAQADYERAKSGYEQASGAEMQAAQALVAARMAANDKAQADLARMRPLAAKAEISKQQFDAVTAQAKVAESELRAAREKLAATEKESEQRRSGVQAAKARLDQTRAGLLGARAARQQVNIRASEAKSAAAMVQQARANLEAAELQLSYTQIVAPSDGVVTKKSVEPGQIIQPGQSLFVLVPLTDVWVTANFKETQLAHVKPGQKAVVEIDMYGKSFRGKVDSIAGATGARLSLLPPENASGNFVKVVQRVPVKIVLDPIPPDKAVLRPGMNVEATIVTR